MDSRGALYESASATCSGSTTSDSASAAIVRATRATLARPRPESGSRSTARSSSSDAASALVGCIPASLAAPSATRSRTTADASPGGEASSSALGRGIGNRQIEAIEQRPRDPVAIGGDPGGRARTVEARISAGAAGAEVHRADEAEVGREVCTTACSHDRDNTILERLPQGLEHRARELGELVEEEHSAMREADLAGPGDRTASDDGRRRGAVMRSAKRGLTEKARPVPSRPAIEWIRVTSRACSRLSGGRMAGSRRASIDFPCPAGLRAAGCGLRWRRSREHVGLAPARGRRPDRRRSAAAPARVSTSARSRTAVRSDRRRAGARRPERDGRQGQP